MMMKQGLYFLVPTAFGLLFSCQSASTGSETAEETAGASSFSEQSYRSYVTALASDELEGRKPFTEGEKKTLAYLEEQAKALDLQPGNGDSYLQEVPLMEITTTAAPQMQVKTPKGNITLQGREDYIVWAGKPEPTINLEQAELVFAGFGIVAPEYNWNDYAGLDVKGKVAVIFVNDPGYYKKEAGFFNGSAMTYYGRWTYKYEEAARQGAIGCLIVHETGPAGYGINVVQNNWNTAKQYLDPQGKELTKCAMEGWLSSAAASRLFEASGTTLAAAQEKALTGSFKPEPMNISISTSMQTTAKYDKSYNFVAAIPGSQRPQETIIYTAHWDHLGIGKADSEGDSIYNGAVDNASGVAGLLEIAKAVKSEQQPPHRTVVFLAVTAEEQGLLGSAYYAENPLYPIEKTVANLNVDMLNPYGKTKDIVVVGKGQSELEDYLGEEARKVDRYVETEATPEAGLYYRSDHFNFAKVGVPAMFVGAGVDNIEKGKAHGEKMQEGFVTNYYHKLSDEVTEEWQMDGILEDLKLLYAVGRRLAYSEEWPGWKEGSEFKAVRDKQQSAK